MKRLDREYKANRILAALWNLSVDDIIRIRSTDETHGIAKHFRKLMRLPENEIENSYALAMKVLNQINRR